MISPEIESLLRGLAEESAFYESLAKSLESVASEVRGDVPRPPARPPSPIGVGGPTTLFFQQRADTLSVHMAGKPLRTLANR